MFLLLLSRACTQPSRFLLITPPVRELQVLKNLEGGIAGTADPRWPNILYHMATWSVHKELSKRRKGRRFTVLPLWSVFVFPSCLYAWQSPAFQWMAEHLPATESGELIPWLFAFLVHVLSAFLIDQSLSQPLVFSLSLLWFSPPWYLGGETSICMELNCWLCLKPSTRVLVKSLAQLHRM